MKTQFERRTTRRSARLGQFARALVTLAMIGLGGAAAQAGSATSTLVGSSLDPALYWEPVTFGMYVVGYGGGMPTGQVQVNANSYLLDTPTLGALGSARSISSGSGHSCALNSAGGVMCWGANYGYQLGDGTTTNRRTPVAVGGLSTGMAAVAAGDQHGCALTAAGGVKCWGTNANGQLGDGSTTTRSSAVDVGTLTSGVVAITTGYSHSCALTNMGGVRCWGANGNGQLGNGSTTDSSTPVQVGGLTSGVVAISAGYFHTCAVTNAGTVKCWGYNGLGGLGDGTTTSRSVPTPVSGISASATAISAGAYHSCAVVGSAAKCWGSNSTGQLGNGSTTTSVSPVQVSGLGGDVVDVAAGASHSCALTTAGAMSCWGSNYLGRLGTGNQTSSTVPVAVSGLSSGVVAISPGGSHSCAQIGDGGVQCWGSNQYGQIGNGSDYDQYSPVAVTSLTSALQARTSSSWTGLASGDITVVAVYPGDATHDTSTSSSFVQTIVPLATSTSLGASKLSSLVGEPVTLTSTVTSSGPAPTGQVTFRYDGSYIDWNNLTNGSTSITTAAVPVGSHSLTATYGGDNGHATSVASALTLVVSKGTTTTTVSASTTNAAVGSAVTFTARVDAVAPASGTPVGTVTFKEGATTLGTGDLAGGVATFTTSTLAEGNHTITASFPGDGSFLNSDGTGPVVVVYRPTVATTTTLTTSAASTSYGIPVTLTATVAATSGVPIGTVNFIDTVNGASTTIGSISLASGSASLVVSDLSVGSHSVVASYGGSTSAPTAIFTASTSNTATVTVAKADTVLLLGSAKPRYVYGNTARFAAKMTAFSTGRPSGTVSIVEGSSTFGYDGWLTGGNPSIATGAVHSCAVAPDGGVKCWGDGSSGQLGNGRTDAVNPTPISVLNLGAKAVAVAAGGSHSCALTATGGVECWGANGSGQLGDGSTTTRLTAVAVQGLSSGVTAIAAGFDHTCALKADSTVWCWGNGTTGALGNGQFTSSSVPLQVPTLAAVSIAAGRQATCALDGDGGLACWGSNAYGKLGDGTTINRASPLPVPGLSADVGWVSLSLTGDHTCAAVADGTSMKCWGNNADGQLGVDGIISSSPTPVDVTTLTDLAYAPSTGSAFTCALDRFHATWCWGRNFDGSLGNGNLTGGSTFGKVLGAQNYELALSSGDNHSCAIYETGAIWCWGAGSHGQIGNNGSTSQPSAVKVVDMTAARQLQASVSFSTLFTGTHALSATWGGDTHFNAATSPTLPISVVARPTTTTLDPISPSVYGEAIQLLAHVAGTVPTVEGKVEFIVDDVTIGYGSLTSGLAPLTVANLPGGDHQVVAYYTGNSTDAASTSPAQTVTVNKAATTTAVQVTPPSAYVGEAITYTVTLSSVTPTPDLPSGTVTFSENGETIGTTTITNGYGIFVTTALGAGVHTTTATYTGSQSFAGSGATAPPVTIAKYVSSTTLTVAPASPVFGQTVTLQVAVSTTGSAAGTVSFTDADVEIGSATVVGGVATWTSNSLPVGSHSFKAVYTGDAGHSGSTSTAVTRSIAKGATTTTAHADTTTAARGTAITFTATVSPTAPATGVPSGTVTFKEGTTVICTVSLAGGTGSCNTNTLTVGTHSIVGSYAESGNYLTSSAATITVTVTKAESTTALAIAPTAPVFGQSVTLTATVSGPSGIATSGSVVFGDGTTSLGSASLNGGIATWTTTTLAVGAHTISAEYGGNGDLKSSSTTGSVTIAKGGTTTTATADATTILPGATVKLTAKVAVVAPATGTPTGSVMFKDGLSILGTADLAGDTATLSTSKLTTGTHAAIVASFVGSATYGSSNSAAVSVAVDPRIGAEFRVNTTTVGSQQQSAIAPLSGGGFVSVWSGESGAVRNIYAQRYAAAGTALGSETVIFPSSADLYDRPAVVPMLDGGFTTAWRGSTAAGAGNGLWLQRRSSAGVVTVPLTRIDTTRGTAQSGPALSIDSNGKILAAWMSNRPTGGGIDLYVQAFDAATKKSGSEIKLNTLPMLDIVATPSMATMTNGDRIVVWLSTTRPYDAPVVKGQRLTAAGVKKGAEFVIRPNDEDREFVISGARVVGRADGGWVVVWSARDGSMKSHVGITVFSPMGVAKRIHTMIKPDASVYFSNERSPDVAAHPGGGFTVAWGCSPCTPAGQQIRAQRFDATGTAVDVAFAVNTTTSYAVAEPRVTIRNLTDFLVIWTAVSQDGDKEGVYGQRLSIAPIAP